MNLYFLLSVISLFCLGLQYEPLQTMTIWGRTEIEHGQWWRILTGNFTHSNFAHLAMNLAGLWVIGFLFRPTSRQLLSVFSVTGIVVGVAMLASDFDSYCGLSGTLHGLFAYGALNEWLNGRKSSGWLVLGVVAKVVWEQTLGAAEETEALIGVAVATGAHLAGLVSGILWALYSHFCNSNKNRKHKI